MKLKLGRLTKRLLLVLLFFIGIGGLYFLYLTAVSNFHVVSPGQIYRASQMSGRVLSLVIQQHNIKTILNLRGANGDRAWYCGETNIASQLGVKHFDFGLSAHREVTDEEMDQILAIIRAAPKPVLIHCQMGADRTGLVSALCLYSIEQKPSAEAGRELSMRYAHFPYLFWRDTGAMDNSFWRYVRNDVHRASAQILQ